MGKRRMVVGPSWQDKRDVECGLGGSMIGGVGALKWLSLGLGPKPKRYMKIELLGDKTMSLMGSTG